MTDLVLKICVSKKGNLYPIDSSIVKRKITQAINAENKAKLSMILENLKACEQAYPEQFKACEVALAAKKSVSAKLAALNKKPPIIIKTARAEYDLTCPKRRRRIESNIQSLVKKQKKSELKKIHNQLLALTTKQKKKAGACIGLIEKGLLQIAQSEVYQSYASLLKNQFSLMTRDKSPFYLEAADQLAVVNRYQDVAKLESYLKKPVSTKLATGEEALRQVQLCFQFDYKRIKHFLDKEQGMDSLFNYAVVANNVFAHNSNCYSAQGYGKSTVQDNTNPLYYFRSQYNHPGVVAYAPKNSTYYGRPNQAAKQLLMDFIGDKHPRWAELGDYNSNGCYTGSANYFGLFVAYAGLRSHNVSHAYESLTDRLFVVPAKDLPARSRSGFPHLNQSLLGIKQSFSVLHAQYGAKTYFNNLQSSVSIAQTDMARLIVKEASVKNTRSDPLLVSYPSSCAYFYIDLYPGMDKDLRESDNYKEGVTNVLLGFYGGLLNYYSARAGLHDVVQRRQSFAFVNPTLTDAGAMRIRFSLGEIDETYKEIIVTSLQSFRQLLKTFNLPKPYGVKTARHRQLIKKMFKPVERPRGKSTTVNTGNYFRNSSRVLDDQWVALLAAEKYLHDNDSLDDAFCDYLEKFVIARCDQKKVGGEDHLELSRHGYHMSADVPVQRATTDSPLDNITLKQLHNVLKRTLSFVQAANHVGESYSLFHVMLKLLHNCQKASALLSCAEGYELSHLQAKAKLLIGNMLEYLILLAPLVGYQQTAAGLANFKVKQYAQALDVSPEEMMIYFNDGGQQANTVGTLLMIMQCQAAREIYIVNDGYYEVPLFLNEVSVDCEKVSPASATVWFCDIASIDQLAKQSSQHKKTLKAVVIDITNNSSMHVLHAQASLIGQLQNQGVWTILSCSTLKREQLGQDKYQWGRNVVIKPSKDAELSPPVKKYFEAISDEVSSHTTVTTFRQMVELMMNEGVSDIAWHDVGLFATSSSQVAKSTSPVLKP